MEAANLDPKTDAEKLINEIKEARVGAESEADLQDSINSILDNYIGELDITTSKGVERTTISGGRMDTVYGDLIIEYKEPNAFKQKKNVEEAITGREESEVGGLQKYLLDSARKETSSEITTEEALARKVGVGFDGYRIFFYKFHPGETVNPTLSQQKTVFDYSEEGIKGEFDDPNAVEVYPLEDGIFRFLAHLRGLSRKALTPEELTNSFGPEGPIAIDIVHTLYNKLTTALDNGNPKVETLYEEWERVFGIIYGEDPEMLEDEKKGFGQVYEADEDVDVTKFLFAVQTYYGFFSKLLVLDLFSMFEESIVQTEDLLINDDKKLKQRLERIESGDEFELAGFPHFYEENQLIWYLSTWDKEIASSFRQMAETLEEFEPATTTIRPELAQDLLKSLYEDLIPKSIRHSLGEYLTPDWLAQHTIDRAGYEGGESLLDPGCGSGTFLIEAINKVKIQSNNKGQDLVDEITGKVVGFDLNPLSVMAARANYLIALGDEIYKSDDVNIPVYQCDSVLIPTKEISPQGRRVYNVSTGEGEFSLPELNGRETIEELLDLVHQCVKDDYTSDEFLDRYESEISVDEDPKYEVEELYRKIKYLDEENRNRIWTRLLRNGLAPVFEDEFEYIIGNPPWINWESISEEYREATRDLWREYDLYSTEGDYGSRRLGGSKTDAAMMFTYISADKYLKSGGTLSFLIPETHFKAEAASGFRKFQLDDEPLKVRYAEDLSDFDPFDASNRTGIICLEKGLETQYPIEYIEWKKNRGASIGRDLPLGEIENRVTKSTLAASPINEDNLTSSWLPAKPELLEPMKKVFGDSVYNAVEGSNNEGLNGLFCLSILNKKQNGDIIIKNRPDTGRKDVQEIRDEIETDYVYPHIQGKDVENKFTVNIKMHTFMFEDGNGDTVSEDQMKNRAPQTYSYLKKFEDKLLNRASYKLNYNDNDPFYDMHGATPSTVAPYKVVWREQKTPFTSAVIGSYDDQYLGEKPIIPSHKLMLVSLENEDEAHYLCAMLNSSIVSLIVSGYAVDVQIGTHVTDHIDIPEYDPDNELHRELAEYSKEAHESTDIEESMYEIDRLSASVWGISDSLKEIRNAASEL